MTNLPRKKKTQTSKALANAISAFTPEAELAPAVTADTDLSPPSAPAKDRPTGQSAAKSSGKGQPYSPGRFAKASAKISSALNAIRHKVTGQSTNQANEATPAQFKNWAVKAFNSETVPLPEASQAFLSWLMACSAAELQTLTDQVAQHCATHHFNPGWLFDGQAAISPQLKQAATTSVMLYCLAAHSASQTQADIEAIARFQRWQANPGQPPAAAIFQHLFVDLVEQQHLPGPPLNLLMASEQRRNTYLVETLSRFANRNPEIFYARLNQVQV